MSMVDAQVPVIDIQGMDFSYNGQPVLEGVELQVPQGEFLGIIGPNGGGKTTLAKLVLGLLTPDSGTIRVFGRPPKDAARRIGYVPQHLHIRPDFPIAVLDIVLMGRLNEGTKRRWNYSVKDQKRALESLERVGLERLGHLHISQLSGGQRQRVLIARALVGDPDLLILDEPTSNIDPRGKFCFFQFLEELQRDITICIVSHDMSILASRLTSLACVNRRLAYSHKPELTEEMVTLLYGSHDPHSCPAGAYIKDRTGKLPEVTAWLS